jgi:DNA cross-link repair 1A protein
MVLHPAIARAKIDTCYLDTTYLNPKYCFPPQPQVIEACANLARRQVLGISEKAPPLDDNKDEKPDLHAVAQEEQERSKEMMEGWLVKKEDVEVKLEKREGEEDVKEELVEVKPKTKGRTLVVMGTYSIGKERIVKGGSGS